MIHGRNLIITDANDVAVIAAAKTCTIRVKAEMVETSMLYSATARRYKPGRTSWSIDIGALVLAPSAQLLKAGLAVNVRVQLAAAATASARAFDGTVTYPTVQQSGLGRWPSRIYWDTSRKMFLGWYNNLYYLTWADGNTTPASAYTSPSNGDIFATLSSTYVYIGGTLVTENGLQGQAYFAQCDITATEGSLAQGSFSLQGTDELTAIS